MPLSSDDLLHPTVAHALLPDEGLVPGFKLEKLIGVGGMGTVYVAEELTSGRRVAIKLIPRLRLSGLPGGSTKREALSLERLSHPNVVRVHEWGEAGDFSYMVMDWVDAPSVAEVLAGGPLSAEVALEVTRQVGEALIHAHELGVVHRDIKPSNLLLDEEGKVWLLDFGIASLRHAMVDMTMTQHTAAFAGSAAYMAPERRIGSAMAAPSEDIYALAVMTYELLMGFPPQGIFPPVSSRHAELGALDGVLARGLAYEPSDRYASVVEFLAALRDGALSHKRVVDEKKDDGRAKDAAFARKLLWWALVFGGIIFVINGVYVSSGPERFSLMEAPGHKFHSNAVGLIRVDGLLLSAWSVLLWWSWRRCRELGQAPSRVVLWLCYLTVVLGIGLIVYEAVMD